MNYGLKRSQAVRIIQDCPPLYKNASTCSEWFKVLAWTFNLTFFPFSSLSWLILSQVVSSCLILSLIVYIHLHLAEKSSSHVVSYCMKSCIFVLKNWLRTKTKWAEADSKTREHKKSHFSYGKKWINTSSEGAFSSAMSVVFVRRFLGDEFSLWSELADRLLLSSASGLGM